MEQNILEKILQGSMEPTDLPLELLREITDGFSTNRIIGEGGFGTVYKGIVGNRNVAVKRIRSSMTIDDKLFRREVSSLMELNHQNVVRFLGLCSHTVETPMKNPGSQGYILAEIRERLLCFEYISNGSLEKKITDELRGLEWDKRYEIIKGICTGLHYLHMEKRILHMDLKPANILLDNDMLPKITDFGVSRLEENSRTISTNPFLSIGYCAPENISGCGRMSVQSDMYSLGAIIIELVTGNKGIPNTNYNILRRWRHRWNKSGKETSLKYHEQVTKCIEIGSLCQNVDPYARPSISEIMGKFVELESMDSCRKIAHDGTTGKIKPPYWEDDMLGAEPLELQFANSGNDKQMILSCSVELSNDTDSFIAFTIHTTSPLPYSIEPNKDIVKPRSKCSVAITLPAAHAQHHNNKKYTKGFMVQSIKVNEGLTTNDINEEVFDRHITVQHVDKIYLSVISEEPCNKEVTDSPTNQAKQYASSEVSRTARPIEPESVELMTYRRAVALLENKKKVMLEVTGGDYTSDRPGLDVGFGVWANMMEQVSKKEAGPSTSIKPGSVQLMIKGSPVAPLLEHKKKVMLELTGGDYTSDRPGLDLVVLVDVGIYVLDWGIEQVKTAMRFLIRKLSPMDRLSFITFDEHTRELWPLRQITEASSRRELEELICTLEGSLLSDGIQEALQAGVHVLADRKIHVGRVAAIMLVSAGLPSCSDSDATSVNVRDVPVYTFFFGGEGNDPMVLHEVAAKSMGGTFSHVVKQDTGGLTMAFSQCLAGLLTVAIQNLELTVAAVGGQSRIVNLAAGSYQQQQKNKDCVTVRFGNLYSTEVRKVIVELLLPKTHRQGSAAEILNVTYSHDRPAGRMKFVAPAETLTVWRTGRVSSSEQLKPAELLSEEARLQMARKVKKARIDYHPMSYRMTKLVAAQNMAVQQSNWPLLTTQLFELIKEEMHYSYKYLRGGCPYALSWESSHDRQRTVGIPYDIQWFATPMMQAKYLQQAKKFVKEPMMLPPSVDDDVKEELGALTTDVTSREEGMRRLAGDVVRMRPPPTLLPVGQRGSRDIIWKLLKITCLREIFIGLLEMPLLVHPRRARTSHYYD